MKTILTAILVVVATLCLISCEALKESERTYSVSYDADQKSGAISLTLKPARPPVNHAAPSPIWAMDDATIERIVRLVEASAKKNAPDLALPVEEIPAIIGK